MGTALQTWMDGNSRGWGT